MNRRLLLESLLESKPQLATPTISLSDSILSIEEVENAEYYDIYVDGVLAHSIDNRPSYTINFSITDESHTNYKYAFRIYDGQDNTGTLLYESTSGTTLTPQTLTCSSGYLTFEFERAESGDPCSFSFTNTGGVSPASASDHILGVHDETFTITGNGTITIDYIDWDD